MKAGVYIIKHTASGRHYVGSSKNIAARQRSHLWHLKRGTHHSRKLQNAWNKHGADAFEFCTVLYCDERNLLMYEQIFIDALHAHSKGFNICMKAYSREGVPHDPDTVAKMRSFQRSHRKKYQWDGQWLCISEIAELVGLPRDTLWRRVIVDGMSLPDAVAMPYKKPGQPIDGMGLSLTFYEWVDRIGCSESFLRLWLRRGLSIEECVSKHKQITVHEFARVSGMDGKMFQARIKAGWSAGDALVFPKFGKGGHHFRKRVYA